MVANSMVANALTKPQPPSFLEACRQRRNFWWKQSEPKTQAPVNPFLQDSLTKKPERPAAPTRGDLSDSSIFEDEELAGPKPKGLTGQKGSKLPPRNPATMAVALDPSPLARKRWERKMVIKEVTKRGRLSRTQLLKQQERVLISKSHDFRTSVKKLVPIAKQIAGKTVEDAIVQMRFSKKKVAKDVKEHLEYARNQAIVARGMGLGTDGKPFNPLQIKTKDGKRVKVTDPTTLYVSQAWCGKGLYGKTPNFKARGQVFMDMNRTTSKYLYSLRGLC